MGATAGAVVQAVERVRNPEIFALALNPGHYIHLDEWIHSPFEPRSRIRLKSGMALQADLIPVSRGPFCAMNGEDGVALADAPLQEKLRANYPGAWERIRVRRAFMRETPGIRLHDSVLPLSNTAGWIPSLRVFAGPDPGPPQPLGPSGPYFERQALISFQAVNQLYHEQFSLDEPQGGGTYEFLGP